MTRERGGGIPLRVFRSFALSIAQLGDRRILAVLTKSIAVTILVFAVFGVGARWGTRQLAATSSGTVGMFLALLATALAFWLLFRLVAVGVVGIFADDIVAAVEARHYPAALADARPVPLRRAISMALHSAVRVLFVNIAALPVYAVLLATGIGTAVGFLAVNGWLLGRDLGDMVAARHLDRAALPAWRRETAGRRFLLGVGNAALFLVPVVNLLAPVLGAAMATHLFHRSRR